MKEYADRGKNVKKKFYGNEILLLYHPKNKV